MEGRLVTVAALQFACSDDVSLNVATAERRLLRIQLILCVKRLGINSGIRNLIYGRILGCTRNSG
ncbi:hypothetical protein SOVF_216820 isoform A [Spinacia oleracea]|nr:hypothetical protein SOVF_216820 isoform A [Spinacia oleracea]